MKKTRNGQPLSISIDGSTTKLSGKIGTIYKESHLCSCPKVSRLFYLSDRIDFRSFKRWISQLKGGSTASVHCCCCQTVQSKRPAGRKCFAFSVQTLQIYLVLKDREAFSTTWPWTFPSLLDSNCSLLRWLPRQSMSSSRVSSELAYI